MSNSEKINAYIYTGLPEEKKDDFIQRIKIHDPQLIIAAVCDLLMISKDALLGTTRKREVVEARFIAMTLIINSNPDMKLKDVGVIFNRDHSTVIYARETYYKLFESNKSFQDKIALIKQRV
jgi:chromosomal replication initiator protein